MHATFTDNEDTLTKTGKMSGSTLMEDPGIPLVGRPTGNFATDSSLPSCTRIIHSKFENISYKLSRRKKLLNRRRVIVNLQFALAMLGIVLMLVETELYFNRVYGKRSLVSLIIKSCISISTLFLLCAVIAYHVTGIQINQTSNSLDDWRLTVTPLSYIMIGLEIAVCAIHPFPGRFVIAYVDGRGKETHVSIDAVLSILMLMRLYLVVRVIVVHSRLFKDTSTHCLGGLNKVKINTVFVFKVLMLEKPGTVLIAIMATYFVINSWALRTCETYYYPDNEHIDLRNCLWVVAISVGYGDITPNSDCGRFISVFTGLMELGTTTLLIAMFESQLEQTRAEKYVHNFVSMIQLEKKRKNAAADVIKNLINILRLKKRGGATDKQRNDAYGKLLKAVHTMKNAKNERLMIGENAIGVVEIAKVVNDVTKIVESVQTDQTDVKAIIEAMEAKLRKIDDKLNALYQMLTRR